MVRKILLVIGAAAVLSGCSFGGAPKPLSNSQNSAAPAGTSAFATKTQPGSLWRTADGGKTFEVKSKIDDKTSITKADILSIAYHPQKQQTIYVGTVDSGIFKTENGGDAWTPIPFPPQKIYSFILDRNDPDNRMFASGVVGDFGKIFRTDDGGKTWNDVYTEPGQKTSITALSQHLRDTNIIFAGTAAGTVVKSVDGGNTWKNIGNSIRGIVADITFDASQSLSTYLLVFDQKLYYSADGGMKWIDWEEEKQKEETAASDKAGRFARPSSLNENSQKNQMPRGIVSIASDPNRSGVIYAGTNAGFFRSADFGKNWNEINIIESAKKFPIRSIAINPKDSNEIVFVAGEAFYKSTDGGVTWMTTGLSVDRGTSLVAYDPFDPKYLFIGLRNFK